MSMVLQAC